MLVLPGDRPRTPQGPGMDCAVRKYQVRRRAQRPAGHRAAPLPPANPRRGEHAPQRTTACGGHARLLARVPARRARFRPGLLPRRGRETMRPAVKTDAAPASVRREGRFGWVERLPFRSSKSAAGLFASLRDRPATSLATFPDGCTNDCSLPDAILPLKPRPPPDASG